MENSENRVDFLPGNMRGILVTGSQVSNGHKTVSRTACSGKTLPHKIASGKLPDKRETNG